MEKLNKDYQRVDKTIIEKELELLNNNIDYSIEEMFIEKQLKTIQKAKKVIKNLIKSKEE